MTFRERGAKTGIDFQFIYCPDKHPKNVPVHSQSIFRNSQLYEARQMRVETSSGNSYAFAASSCARYMHPLDSATLKLIKTENQNRSRMCIKASEVCDLRLPLLFKHKHPMLEFYEVEWCLCFCLECYVFSFFRFLSCSCVRDSSRTVHIICVNTGILYLSRRLLKATTNLIANFGRFII